MLAAGVRGGPLDPPGGPASTDGVRKQGTPISSIPFTINQSGYYYLTRSLTATNPNQFGINIVASGVTVDLNGFSLVGTSTPGIGDGIVVPTLQGDIVIKNGSITTWSHDGISAFQMVRGRVIDVDVSVNRSDGIQVGPGNAVERVTAAENLGDGIVVQGIISYFGGRVTDSLLSQNGGDGLDASADRITIRDNTIQGNGGSGIRAGSSDYSLIVENSVFENGGTGIVGRATSTIIGNVIAGNLMGISAPVGTHVGPQISDPALTTSNPFANVVYDNPPP